MHCVDFFFFLGVFLGFFGAFLTIFAPNLSIYHQYYVKNGFIYKTVNQIIFFSTQCIILLLFLLFSQIKIGGALWAPPPPSKIRSENTPSKVTLILPLLATLTYLREYLEFWIEVGAPFGILQKQRRINLENKTIFSYRKNK